MTKLLYLATFLELEEKHIARPLGQEQEKNIREKSKKSVRE